MRTALTRLSILATVLLVAACGAGGPDDAPPGVTLRARAAAADSARDCPDLTGRYWVERNLIWRRLVERSLPESRRALWWEWLALRGDAADSLLVLVGGAAGADSVWLARDRDYRCASGWLIPSGDVWLRELDAEDSLRYADDPKHQAFTLAIAADSRGPLVGRLHTRSWSQVDVWCGDGCRGFPLPWTISHETRWLTLRVARGASPDAARDDPTPDEVARRTAAAERALELGEQATRPIPIERMVRAMLPVGGEVLAVTRDGAGYRVSVVVPSDTDMPDFVGRLVNTQGMRGAHEQTRDGGWTPGPTRRWRTIVWVPREF